MTIDTPLWDIQNIIKALWCKRCAMNMNMKMRNENRKRKSVAIARYGNAWSE